MKDFLNQFNDSEIELLASFSDADLMKIEYMRKTAAINLNVSDLEGRHFNRDYNQGLGSKFSTYLTDDEEAMAREMLAEQIEESFSLRHPWITGIPTLGIAPAAATENAYHVVANALRRKNPELRERDMANRQAASDHNDQIRRDTQPERVARENRRTVNDIASKISLGLELNRIREKHGI